MKDTLICVRHIINEKNCTAVPGGNGIDGVSGGDFPPGCRGIFSFTPCLFPNTGASPEKDDGAYVFSVPDGTFPSRSVHDETGRRLALLLASGSISVTFYIPDLPAVSGSGESVEAALSEAEILSGYAHKLFVTALTYASGGDGHTDGGEGSDAEYLTLLSFALFFSLTGSPFARTVSRLPGADVSSYVQEAKLFVNDNLASATLASAAGYTGISQEYLSRLFKAQCGTNFSAYLQETRILRAKKYFASGEKNESDVAVRCGFTSIRAFRRRFRESFGLTPLEYIKEADPYGGTE